MSIENRLKTCIRDVADFPKPGILFKDISTIMLDAELSADVLNHLVETYKDAKLDAVAGIESRGFLFGFPLAIKLGIPFILIRKEGKLPYNKIKHAYDLEYGSAVIEMHSDAVQANQRVLIHDDLLATGGSASAAAELIQKSGAEVAGFSFLVELSFLEGQEKLKNYSSNINGGNPNKKLILGNLEFEGDKSLISKKGMLVGGTTGFSGRSIYDEGKFLDYNFSTSYAHSINHKIGIFNVYGNICAKNHIKNFWHLDICTNSYRVNKKIIDDYNQKWYFAPRGGGVIVYNDNNTIENANDDAYVQLLSGKGAGNLPSNQVNCLAKDQSGAIWIGTDNGIGIVNCPRNVIARTCEAEIRIVQYDLFASYLFSGQNITAIAVDGANRKWVGSNNGVWLISEDATKIIQRFTVANSPLPSNNINTISIDNKTGDVYFGTEFGLVSFKSTATEGTEKYNDVLVYPNPISSASFSGTIAIKGLLENADVRFTDINGQLVYKTKALGGQATWNGIDYTGHKPAPGVYLIFAADKLGQDVMVSKLIINP